jgi:hypothetical protein
VGLAIELLADYRFGRFTDTSLLGMAWASVQPPPLTSFRPVVAQAVLDQGHWVRFSENDSSFGFRRDVVTCGLLEKRALAVRHCACL